MRSITLIISTAALLAAGSGSSVWAGDLETIGSIPAQPMTGEEMDAVRGMENILLDLSEAGSRQSNGLSGSVANGAIIDGSADSGAGHVARNHSEIPFD